MHSHPPPTPKAWATATNAPVDPHPLPKVWRKGGGEESQLQSRNQSAFSSAESPSLLLSPDHDNAVFSELHLVLRPDISMDEHLPPMHESPWTPDGLTWYDAKISVLPPYVEAGGPIQKTPGTLTRGGVKSYEEFATGVGHKNKEVATVGGENYRVSRSSVGVVGGGNITDCALVQPGTARNRGDAMEKLRGAGLSITLRPEGGRQRRKRLEREATVAMSLEDERSRLIGKVIEGLAREAKARAKEREEARTSATLAATVSPVNVSVEHKPYPP